MRLTKTAKEQVAGPIGSIVQNRGLTTGLCPHAQVRQATKNTCDAILGQQRVLFQKDMITVMIQTRRDLHMDSRLRSSTEVQRTQMIRDTRPPISNT